MSPKRSRGLLRIKSSEIERLAREITGELIKRNDLRALCDQDGFHRGHFDIPSREKKRPGFRPVRTELFVLVLVRFIVSLVELILHLLVVEMHP